MKAISAQSIRSVLARVGQHEQVNFLFTNRIPRRQLTRFMGWFAKIEQPLVRDLSIGVWRLFADPDLTEAARSDFASLHDCFIRELKPGARAVDPDPATLTSPCDAIVGACGDVCDGTLVQAKGLSYTLAELLIDDDLVRLYRDGRYVTLRLTSSMYHRFHAPHDCHVQQVTYVAGDTFNTNPIAVGRVDKLYCKNERAIVRTRLQATGHLLTLVPVASILVASIRMRFLDVRLHLEYSGPNVIPCDAHFGKGQEMGWFELGSTIIVFAPVGFELAPNVRQGSVIRMGQPLMRLP